MSCGFDADTKARTKGTPEECTRGFPGFLFVSGSGLDLLQRLSYGLCLSYSL